MKLEERYIVLKVADLEPMLTVTQWGDLGWIQTLHDERRKARGAPPMKCVVIEEDWPEYAPTVEAIEKRISQS